MLNTHSSGNFGTPGAQPRVLNECKRRRGKSSQGVNFGTRYHFSQELDWKVVGTTRTSVRSKISNMYYTLDFKVPL